MKTKDMALMQKRADFKRLLLANHLAVHGLERLEASYDALIASDYAKLPMFQPDVSQVEKLLKAFYAEGMVN
jgi:hypothetical protein